MDNAFQPGDPALEVAGVEEGKQSYHHEDHWVVRDEQHKLDGIISGQSSGHYYLLVGEKGTGKTSMILEAMRKINGEGVAMFEAHGDLEIFRLRLGKALDYEFHEEYACLSIFPCLVCWYWCCGTGTKFVSRFLAILAVSSVFEVLATPRLSWISNAHSTNWRRLLSRDGGRGSRRWCWL